MSSSGKYSVIYRSPRIKRNLGQKIQSPSKSISGRRSINPGNASVKSQQKSIKSGKQHFRSIKTESVSNTSQKSRKLESISIKSQNKFIKPESICGKSINSESVFKKSQSKLSKPELQFRSIKSESVSNKSQCRFMKPVTLSKNSQFRAPKPENVSENLQFKPPNPKSGTVEPKFESVVQKSEADKSECESIKPKSECKSIKSESIKSENESVKSTKSTITIAVKPKSVVNKPGTMSVKSGNTSVNSRLTKTNSVVNKSKTMSITGSASETASVKSTSASTKVNLTANNEQSVSPVKIFYIWYYELCRRNDIPPVQSIARSCTWRNNQVLDFITDRIKIEDWQPIWNALRLDTSLQVLKMHSKCTGQPYLESVDTEDKVKKLKNWYMTTCTKYVLENLTNAVCSCVKNNDFLTHLEFDGILIGGQFLTTLIAALNINKNLKHLCFKGCPILDSGCKEICEALQKLPNIDTLELVHCRLTSLSGEYIAKIIKFQQIKRYSESWHTSLRSSDPMVDNMAGLRRLTLNNNPYLGDEGTKLILEELVDDLWIRCIDMQRCGITPYLAEQIIDIVSYNRSLRVADFRYNHLSRSTIAKILQLLKMKMQDGDESEFLWCHTATSLDTFSCPSYVSVPLSMRKTRSTITNFKPMIKDRFNEKPKFEPVKPKPIQKPVPKCKIIKNDVPSQKAPNETNLLKTKKVLSEMFQKAKKEEIKKQKLEMKCRKLQRQCKQLKYKLPKNQITVENHNLIKDYIYKYIQFIKEHKDIKDWKKVIKELLYIFQEVQNIAKLFGISKIMQGAAPSKISINPKVPRYSRDTVSFAEAKRVIQTKNKKVKKSKTIKKTNIKTKKRIKRSLGSFDNGNASKKKEIRNEKQETIYQSKEMDGILQYLLESLESDDSI